MEAIIEPSGSGYLREALVGPSQKIGGPIQPDHLGVFQRAQVQGFLEKPAQILGGGVDRPGQFRQTQTFGRGQGCLAGDHLHRTLNQFGHLGSQLRFYTDLSGKITSQQQFQGRDHQFGPFRFLQDVQFQ